MTTYSGILSQYENEHRLRTIPLEPAPDILDLSSNDYLGLGKRHNEFRPEFENRFGHLPFTSSASRLLSSHQDIYFEYEALLESLYGKPALLFNSGYHANVGCVTALNIPSSLFVCDKLMHASFIDGLNASGCEFKRFPHNNISKLKAILEKESGKHPYIIVAVESIYSMDGDEAPLEEIAALKLLFPEMLLYVDEAHAFGVRGHRGLGICEEKNMTDKTDIIVGTLGKAAASSGAFAICPQIIKSILINRARSFIFSTALPPANIAWSLLMTEKILRMHEERTALKELSEWFAHSLGEATGQNISANSQIIPFTTGDAQKAVEYASKLREAGIIALPIRRPTVPPGGERIRFSLCPGIDLARLQTVVDILSKPI